MNWRIKNLVGLKFNRLTVLRATKKRDRYCCVIWTDVNPNSDNDVAFFGPLLIDLWIRVLGSLGMGASTGAQSGSSNATTQTKVSHHE